MSVLRFSLVLTILLVFASQTFVSLTFAQTSEYEATSALADAEGVVVSAYQAALKAEEAGANASGLWTQLNKAGEYLARAHTEFRLGDFERAADFANLGKSIGEEVKNTALALKDSALSESLQRMVPFMIASVVSVALITLGSLWVWHLLKKITATANFRNRIRVVILNEYQILS